MNTRTRKTKDATDAKAWRSGGNRVERAALIKGALFKAASEVVGEVGYQGASISLITQRAGVAQGTFYNHFESRQAILDQLLPAVGKELLEHIGKAARTGKNLAEREEMGFKGFFSFLKKAPHFFRILNEAESFAPKGYKEHMEMVAAGYMRFLTSTRSREEMPGFEKREIEVIAFILMAARTYLAWRYTEGEGERTPIPPWVVKAYVKFTMHGVRGV
jgi:AcrR family transcriptional regulator